VVRALEAALTDFDVYFSIFDDLVSIDDDFREQRLQVLLGVPPTDLDGRGTGLLPSMYEQRYRFTQWVFHCAAGVVAVAMRHEHVRTYISQMAPPVDSIDNRYTDWLFRFLHRLNTEAAVSTHAPVSAGEAASAVDMFKLFEIATYVSNTCRMRDVWVGTVFVCQCCALALAGSVPLILWHTCSPALVHMSLHEHVLHRYGKASCLPPKVVKTIAPAGDHVSVRVEVHYDPDDETNPSLCWVVYNRRHNDINLELTLSPDQDGGSNHHQPEENPVLVRVNAQQYVAPRRVFVRAVACCLGCHTVALTHTHTRPACEHPVLPQTRDRLLKHEGGQVEGIHALRLPLQVERCPGE